MFSSVQKEGTYNVKKFNTVCHFFGYQARGSLPSKFDCDYAYVSYNAYDRFNGKIDSLQLKIVSLLYRFLVISAIIFWLLV